MLAIVTTLTLYRQTVFACVGDTSCQSNEIDRFFLPLIAASLMKDGGLTALSPSRSTLPVTTSGLDQVVIKPPSRPRPPRESLVPVVKVVHHLETGELIAGGKARLLIGSTHPSARPARATEETGTHDGVRLPPLRQLAPESAIWQMDHMAILPEVPLWPLDGLMLPVNMRLTCGACRPDGAQHHFSGAAHLEMLFDGSVNGWIDDIDLVATDGMTATGSLSFSDARTGHRVVEDQFAKMFLKIGAKETNFRGTLATWMTDRKLVDGALAMVPIDRLSGIGAVAGHFSGAPCTADCGVEN